MPGCEIATRTAGAANINGISDGSVGVLGRGLAVEVVVDDLEESGDVERFSEVCDGSEALREL